IDDVGGSTASTTGSVVVSDATARHGVFFTDGINQLWKYENGAFTNTGAFALQVAAGVDLQGNPEVFFTDGNHLIWRNDNGHVTELGAFGGSIGAYATRLAAGQGMLAFTDGINQVWLFSDATGQFTNTGAFATQVAGGFDAKGNSLFAMTDGINHVYTLAIP